MVHDSLQVGFWALALACLELAVERTGLGWWVGFGIAGGLGILSKYTGVFLFPLAGLAFLTHPDLRPKLKSAGPWLALLIGVLSGIPILIWNNQNGWASARHVLYIGGANPSRHSSISSLEFLGSQLGVVTPILFVLILQAWWETWRQYREGKLPPQEWILWCSSFPLFLFFLSLSIRSKVAGNWPAPAYFGAVLLLAVSLQRRGRLHSALTRWGLILALLMTVTLHWQVARPFLPIPPSLARVDSTARVDGWRDLARQVDTFRRNLPGQSFVGCKAYQIAAELGFYLSDHPQVLILQDRTINHQYRFWNRPADHIGQDAILIAEQDSEINEMIHRFDKVEPLGDVPLIRNGVEVQSFHIYRGSNFKG